MICGSFIESAGRRLEIREVDCKLFVKVLGLWFGGEYGGETDLHEVQQLVSVADRFQVSEVVAALEETMIQQLQVDQCGEVLTWSTEVGLKRLEESSRKLAAARFEEVAKTPGFMTIREDTLGHLLDDDELVVSNEEALWEAVLKWIKAEDGELRGCGLLSKIRFPLMDEDFLLDLSFTAMDGALPVESAELLEGLVAEALQARASRNRNAAFDLQLLGPKALLHRARTGVKWGDYSEGGGRRLEGHAMNILAVAECEGRVCSASENGSIRIWHRATLAHERTLHHDASNGGSEDEFYDPVFALVGHGGRLVSGHDDGNLRVWDVLAGECEQVLEGWGLAPAPATRGARCACGPWRPSTPSARCRSPPATRWAPSWRSRGRCGPPWGRRWWCGGAGDGGPSPAGGTARMPGLGKLGGPTSRAPRHAGLHVPSLGGPPPAARIRLKSRKAAAGLDRARAAGAHVQQERTCRRSARASERQAAWTRLLPPLH